VFRPYSGVKTSILFLDKKLARQFDKILFFKINADGFDLGDQRREIAANDLPEAERIVKAWLGGNLDKIAENPVSWKTIDKRQLLEHRGCILHAEAFLGGPVADQTVDVARIADVVEINPKKNEVRELPPETLVSFVPMDDVNADTPDFVPSSHRPLKEVLTGYTYFRNTDVLLAKITPCFENGKGGIARNLLNGIGFGSTEFYVLRASERVLPEYLYHAVMRAEFRKEGAAKMSGAAGQQRITRDFLENHEIALPPIDEQRRIVDELGGYQKVIDGARQILAVYRPFLNVDASWPTVSIGTLFEIRYGVSVSIPDTVDANGTQIISTAETRVDGSLDLSNIRRIRWEKNYDKFLAKPNTLLFNWRNAPKHVGKTVLFEGHSEKVLFASFLLSLERKTKDVENKFVWLVLNQLRYQGYFLKNARQAVNQANFNADELSHVEIPLPPLTEQRRLVAELDAEAAQMEAVRSLLPRFEAKIQRVLDRVWGNGKESAV
jgi:type I restriction enzyme M protein